MSVIKFKGKSIKSPYNSMLYPPDKWVYGFLVIDRGRYFIVELAKIRSIYEEDNDIDICEVRPETVGQYIELNDIHNREIYEGDIIGVKGEVIGVVKRDRFTCRFIVDNGESITGITFDSIKECEWEVIGNIHDNPELLEVKE